MTRFKNLRIIGCLLALIVLPRPAGAATGTIMPTPFQTVFDTNGDPINAACVWTYIAGGATPVATYTDVGLITANSNPIVADSAGRFVAYLTQGVSYKFTYETACTAPAHGTTIRTVDNVSAVPGTSAGVDLIGTAGEAITAGQAVYLSDGSGSKNAGQWYKADTTNPYSSSLPLTGMAPSAISSGAAGTIRISGQVTGLSGLTVGADYYVSTSGTITATAPANNRRLLGRADSTTTLIVAPNPSMPMVSLDNCAGRLTLTTGTPVTGTDVTAATTLFFTPYRGNRCALFDGTSWSTRSFAEVSIAVPATTSTMYDVWFYDNAGTLTLELLAWTNDTTRATALTTQDGVLVKTGVTTRRYVGSFRTTGVSGQTEDSFAKRYVWNYYNRVQRAVRRLETTATWTYTLATYQQANASATNQVDVVIGVAEVSLHVQLSAVGNNSGGGVNLNVSIGEDSATTADTGVSGGYINGGATDAKQMIAVLDKYPAVGRHFYTWLEKSSAAGTTTWSGTNQTAQSGLSGFIQG